MIGRVARGLRHSVSSHLYKVKLAPLYNTSMVTSNPLTRKVGSGGVLPSLLPQSVQTCIAPGMKSDIESEHCYPNI